MLKQAFYTGGVVIAMMMVLNNFDATRDLMRGGNKYFG